MSDLPKRRLCAMVGKAGRGMTTEIVEGEVRELPPERSIVPAQPGQAIVTSSAGPVDMLARASEIATALSNMVEKQKLYTVIRAKKYPNVEAWQTIGRMDNVVAREAARPVRNEDGSWEAFVELVRLSDGMVIGNGSALCGAARDGDWTGRPDHEKRSMAVTRATSRAFRQQYSWIMALAGYEPTPSDDMPQGDEKPIGAPDAGGASEYLLGIEAAEGTVRLGTAAYYKLEVKETPEGPAFGFRLERANGEAIPQVVVEGNAAKVAIAATGDPLALKDHWIRVRGRLVAVRTPGRRSFNRLHATEIETREWMYPASEGATGQAPEAQAATETPMSEGTAAPIHVPVLAPEAAGGDVPESAPRTPADSADLAAFRRANPSLALLPEDAA